MRPGIWACVGPLVGTLGYMPAEFSDLSNLGLVSAGIQSRGYVEKMEFSQSENSILLAPAISVQIAMGDH